MSPRLSSRIRASARSAALAIAVAASAGTAFASEGNGPSYPGNDVPDVVLGRTTVLPAPTAPRGVMLGGNLVPDAGHGAPSRQDAYARQHAVPDHHAGG